MPCWTADAALLDELRAFYRSALAERVQTLSAARAAASDPVARTTMRRMAHALRGSGSTYGFPDVTAAAARVEEASEADLLGAVDGLLTVIRVVADGHDEVP